MGFPGGGFHLKLEGAVTVPVSAPAATSATLEIARYPDHFFSSVVNNVHHKSSCRSTTYSHTKIRLFIRKVALLSTMCIINPLAGPQHILIQKSDSSYAK